MRSSHRRYNPMLDEWVLCSPGRLERPWRGEIAAPVAREPVPAYSPDCTLCPGSSRPRGAKNPEYRGVFAFDNDYPAVSEPAIPVREVEGHPLFVSKAESGRCRVVCFSERHDLHLGSMSVNAIRELVSFWAAESERLAREDGAAYVQIFENRGAMMGASDPHPHGQIWAVRNVPSIPERMSRRFRDHWVENGRDLLGDYLEEELRRSERIVEATEHWVQVVPYWAVWPFETMLVPRRFVGVLSELGEDERLELAAILRRLVRRYDAIFEMPFPYSMGWYQRPYDFDREGFRLHAVFLPPLLRSASVRKFLVGYELTAEPQRDLTAEEAAMRLRGLVLEEP